MARRESKTLGFIPLVLMALIWAILQQAMIPIGQITSRPGYFNPNLDPPKYGCPIPEAAP